MRLRTIKNKRHEPYFRSVPALVRMMVSSRALIGKEYRVLRGQRMKAMTLPIQIIETVRSGYFDFIFYNL